MIIYFSSGNKNNNKEKLATKSQTTDSIKIEQDEIPLYNVNTNSVIEDSAYLYRNNEGRKFYRVQNSILFWTFENNRMWKAKKQMNLYKEPYSDEIIDKIKANDRILGLDVEYHYYENNKAKITKLNKSTFDKCPDGSVKVGDTIFLLNAEGECYWNVINNGKFTGVHFSNEGKRLTESMYDGCNMIEGERITFNEEYIVWVKVQTPSRKIGWLKFSNKKGDNFFDNVKVEDEGDVGEQSTTTSTIQYRQVTDIDRNVYKTVKIGNQVWMAENLNVSRFRNGDYIREAKTNEEWEYCGENKIPAWCYYDNVPNKNKGKLYNFWTVIDERGLAPLGWDIPSEKDFHTLANLYGGSQTLGKHLKSIDFPGSKKGTNKSGFNAIFVGWRKYNGVFLEEKLTKYWAKGTLGLGGYRYPSSKIMIVYKDRDDGEYSGMFSLEKKESGIPIRCIQK